MQSLRRPIRSLRTEGLLPSSSAPRQSKSISYQGGVVDTDLILVVQRVGPVNGTWLLHRKQGGAEWEVALDLKLGHDYVVLPKSVWDVMMDWYGGGPVFCRKVVKVSYSGLQLPLKARGQEGKQGPTDDAVSAGR